MSINTNGLVIVVAGSWERGKEGGELLYHVAIIFSPRQGRNMNWGQRMLHIVKSYETN